MIQIKTSINKQFKYNQRQQLPSALLIQCPPYYIWLLTVLQRKYSQGFPTITALNAAMQQQHIPIQGQYLSYLPSLQPVHFGIGGLTSFLLIQTLSTYVRTLAKLVSNALEAAFIQVSQFA
ncbi:Hypothetical_protein [Hexamita inflata]|uniref:Hypothetical_protein n=1 Tax=Hexamita inflata TaxID=28002 RepID=A0AA86R1H6_9EUKA|nr:Hypothetical protein HINF_LOCUS55017 [Hexamita inflata]